MSPPCSICGYLETRERARAVDGVCVVECARCGIVFLRPFPAVNPARHYDAAYYRPWREEQRLARERLWTSRVDLLERYARTGRLLDVGCGDGSFLRAARARGWSVAGTEVSTWAIETLGREDQLCVYPGDLAGLTLDEGGFDAVTLWHVLEHTPAPLQTLLKIRRLLRAGGVLMVAVPNAGWSLFRCVYPLARFRRLQYYTPGEREIHLYHFTPRTLRMALGVAGFQVMFQGVDQNGLSAFRALLDRLAIGVHAATGLVWSEAVLAIARTPGCS
jgi:2-polyprenyl-3-methyl-5-hydroxy-6-metoxy-1,4-benzoquinol methylase